MSDLEKTVESAMVGRETDIRTKNYKCSKFSRTRTAIMYYVDKSTNIEEYIIVVKFDLTHVNKTNDRELDSLR